MKLLKDETLGGYHVGVSKLFLKFLFLTKPAMRSSMSPDGDAEQSTVQLLLDKDPLIVMMMMHGLVVVVGLSS